MSTTPEDPLRAALLHIFDISEDRPNTRAVVTAALAAPPVAEAEVETHERLRVWVEAQCRGMAFTDRQAESFDALMSDYRAALRSAAPALDADDPRFRVAVKAVFEAPGEFGPAQGYYAGDIDHFIDMLRAALK